MERKLKKQKGITLVALIITIIVLLILAMVAISVVRGNGILNHAQNAKNAYSSSQYNESVTLNSYVNYVDNKIKKEESISIIKFTITFAGVGERSFECPLNYNSWEEWANSEYNTISDAYTVLLSITLEVNGKDLIDPTTKPINGHKYGYDGPVSW